MKQQACLTLSLLVAVAALISGCADLDLDRAYKSGQLSASDYYRLKSQREAQRRQQMFLQQQAYQQQQNQIMADYSRSINTAPATPMFSTPFLQNRPDADTTRQQEPKFPTGYDLGQVQKRQGFPTGRTRLTLDGTWREYKTLSGTTYWSLER